MRQLVLSALLLIPALALAGEAVVTRVVDGDTVEAGGRDLRLQDIDAPESSQPHGGEALLAPLGDGDRHRLYSVQGAALAPIGAAVAQVLEVAVEDRRQRA